MTRKQKRTYRYVLIVTACLLFATNMYVAVRISNREMQLFQRDADKLKADIEQFTIEMERQNKALEAEINNTEK